MKENLTILHELYLNRVMQSDHQCEEITKSYIKIKRLCEKLEQKNNLKHSSLYHWDLPQ